MTGMVSLQTERLVALALEEDLGPGDATTNALIPTDLRGKGSLMAREELVVSGLNVASAVFQRLDPDVVLEWRVSDGDLVGSDTALMDVEGRLAPILSAERTALNFLQRLSGIASLTRKYVRAIAGSRARLLDTRKTTPGWRLLEKAAVRHGGAGNHRMALFDGILIKDNHLSVVGDLETAVRLARRDAPALLKIEVEVESLKDLRAALDVGADLIMLDNMSDEKIAESVALVGGRVPLEVSGGVTIDRLPTLARLGVDFISCGAITHSATSVDIALDIDPSRISR